MQTDRLRLADHELANLPPGRREAVREIVIDAVRRGGLTPSGRAFLTRATGSTFLAEVLDEAIAEHAARPHPAEVAPATPAVNRVK